MVGLRKVGAGYDVNWEGEENEEGEKEYMEHEVCEAACVLKKAEMIKNKPELYQAALAKLNEEKDALDNIPGLKGAKKKA